ncbi:MAG: hypothetical protein EB116_08530 [Betaproteobacteria bacterium]|nr:hypothetical protein [Betaproteobacteria bacterium]
MHGLFAQPVGMFDRPLSDDEKSLLMGLETRPNMGNTTSTDNFVLRRSGLTNLRSWIEDCVADYFKATANPKHDVSLRITQSWVNYSEQGQYHHKHAHPNSLVSGVFYINTNDNDRIYFYRSGFQQIKFPTDGWNQWNSESWWFEAIEGRLVLFPSSLEHMVPTVEGEKTRVSLSFNTFPVGTVGEEMDLTGLKLEA